MVNLPAILVASNSSNILPTIVCDDIHHCRTLLNIIVSCASTVFLCTWVASHPDVPGDPYEPWWRMRTINDILEKRMAIVLVALLAPEIILWCAFLDWINSCEKLTRIMQDHPECEWTETHAQLLNMRGFQVINADGTLHRLSIKLPIPPSYKHMLSIPVDEIEDRSKGDFVAKTIVVIQTLWFTLQVFIRGIQGLSLTKLELTTLGHTILSLFIYWCWWNKPRNVKFPFDVYPISKRLAGSQPRRWFGAAAEKSLVAFGLKEHSVRQRLPMRVRLGIYLNAVTTTRHLVSWEAAVLIICGIIIGGMFGAVHCLAWYGDFPSDIESQSWRISAVIVTAAPGVGILLGIAAKMIHDIGWIGRYFDLGCWITRQSVLVAAIYALARISLLALAVLALRNLPYNAYVTPSWTTFVPHI